MPTATESEKWAGIVFERMGRAVHRCSDTAVKRGNFWVSQNNDLYNVFDLLTIDHGSAKVGLYQVTRSLGSPATKRRRKIEKWWEDNFKTIQIQLNEKLHIELGLMVYQSERSRINGRYKDRYFRFQVLQQDWTTQNKPLWVGK